MYGQECVNPKNTVKLTLLNKHPNLSKIVSAHKSHTQNLDTKVWLKKVRELR